MAQGELGAVPQVLSCVEDFVPNGQGGGKSRSPCHSKNSCLWCTPQELAKERATIAALVKAWSADSEVYFATFTLKLPKELELGAKYRFLKDAWALFVADSRVNKLRAHNELKYVRVLEEVVSDGVWFPHFHLVFSVKLGPDSDPEALKLSLRQLWTSKAHKLGLTETLSSVQNITPFVKGTHWKLADYLVKHGRVGLFLDTEAIETSTEGLTPFHVFQLFVATGDEGAARLWSDFQFFSLSQRRITYSNRAKS